MMLQFQATMTTPSDTPNEVPPVQTTLKTVSVHTLVEFVLTQGDLTPGGFQRRDRAQAGTAGHRRVQRSRPEGYQTEVEVSYRLEEEEPPLEVRGQPPLEVRGQPPLEVRGQPPLEVRGRIDGLYADQEPVILEEIKTTTLPLDTIGEGHNPLHWAQAQCYAFMLAHQENLDAVCIHLTYYQLDSREEKTFERHFSARELETFFFDLLRAYLDWFH
jgi:DNA excision repair protein ERCC-2